VKSPAVRVTVPTLVNKIGRETVKNTLPLFLFLVANAVFAGPYESKLLGRTLDVPVIPFERTSFTRPLVGETSTVYLGENMISQKKGHFALCLNVTQAHRSKHINLTAGEICQKKASGLWYTRDRRSLIQRPNGLIVDRKWAEEVSIQRDKKGLKVCSPGVFGGSCIKGMDPKELVETETEMLIEDQSAFQQKIEYLGKEGDILRFAYSETVAGTVENPATGLRESAEIARDAFTREFVVDLSEDNIVAFKGALIEVEKATSSRIVYKIIRNFSGR
jgi:hypothetical protein